MNNQISGSEFTHGQEIVHSIIHAFGVLFGISSIPVLTAIAANGTSVAAIVGAAIYGFCFIMLFTFSALYHAVQQPQLKRALEVLDHISIYFLIAGTYTPFLLIYLNDAFGIGLLAVLWSLTLVGIVFKIFFTGRFEVLSVIIYLAMGWILIAGGRRFFTVLPNDVLTFIIIGGGLYTTGIIFYVWRKLYWHHAIWHLLVLFAALCHYVAVLLAV